MAEKIWSSLTVSPCAARTPTGHAACIVKGGEHGGSCPPRRPGLWYQAPALYAAGNDCPVGPAAPATARRGCRHDHPRQALGGRRSHATSQARSLPPKEGESRLPAQGVVGHHRVAPVGHGCRHKRLLASSNLVVPCVDVPPGLCSYGLCHVREHLQGTSDVSQSAC
jgi:hypothetical protein